MSLDEEIADLRRQLTEAADSEEEATIRLRLALVLQQGAESMFCTADEPAEAREAFYTSAIQYRKAVEVILSNYQRMNEDSLANVPSMLEEGLALATITHDETVQQAIANLTLDLSERDIERYGWTHCQFYSLKTYASSLIGHPATEALLEKTLDAHEYDGDPEVFFKPGIWTALRGIVTDDTAMIRDGIETHVTTLRKRYDKGENGIFFQGLAITILARKHGHDIKPESPAIPDELLTPAGQS